MLIFLHILLLVCFFFFSKLLNLVIEFTSFFYFSLFFALTNIALILSHLFHGLLITLTVSCYSSFPASGNNFRNCQAILFCFVFFLLIYQINSTELAEEDKFIQIFISGEDLLLKYVNYSFFSCFFANTNCLFHFSLHISSDSL